MQNSSFDYSGSFNSNQHLFKSVFTTKSHHNTLVGLKHVSKRYQPRILLAKSKSISYEPKVLLNVSKEKGEENSQRSSSFTSKLIDSKYSKYISVITIKENKFLKNKLNNLSNSHNQECY